mmetsp:Transcript_29160/g.43938  ORF Transcript_29160/g.43938 Transcript_29160/m.43938 type:complete len:115 (-) Transcript_29160:48-392(-)
MAAFYKLPQQFDATPDFTVFEAQRESNGDELLEGKSKFRKVTGKAEESRPSSAGSPNLLLRMPNNHLPEDKEIMSTSSYQGEKKLIQSAKGVSQASAAAPPKLSSSSSSDDVAK